MRPIHTLLATCLCGISLLLTGCASDEQQARNNARKMWQALAQGEISKAREYVTLASRDGLSSERTGHDTEFAFGEGTRDENGRMLVPTTMRETRDGKSEAIPFTTIMLKEDGEWRVDMHATTGSMIGGAMGEAFRALGKGLQSFGNELGKTIDEATRELRKQNPPPPPSPEPESPPNRPRQNAL